MQYYGNYPGIMRDRKKTKFQLLYHAKSMLILLGCLGVFVGICSYFISDAKSEQEILINVIISSFFTITGGLLVVMPSLVWKGIGTDTDGNNYFIQQGELFLTIPRYDHHELVDGYRYARVIEILCIKEERYRILIRAHVEKNNFRGAMERVDATFVVYKKYEPDDMERFRQEIRKRQRI